MDINLQQKINQLFCMDVLKLYANYDVDLGLLNTVKRFGDNVWSAKNV